MAPASKKDADRATEQLPEGVSRSSAAPVAPATVPTAIPAPPPAGQLVQDPNSDPIKGARVGAPPMPKDRKPIAELTLDAAIDHLKAFIENHTKWIDWPPAEGEDGYGGFDRQRLIQERSMAQSALNMLGVDTSHRLR